MAVLSQFPLRLLIHTTAIEMLLTILSCYAMAVHDGHVKPWLPTISECGVFPPEKYFFRYGFVIGACLMAAQGVATYNALKSWAKSRTYLFLIAVASFCLGLVGVVSMREDSSVHNGEFDFPLFYKRRGPCLFHLVTLAVCQQLLR